MFSMIDLASRNSNVTARACNLATLERTFTLGIHAGIVAGHHFRVVAKQQQPGTWHEKHFCPLHQMKSWLCRAT